MNHLVELIETPEIRNYYKASKSWSKRSEGNESVQSAIWALEDIKEWVPIQSHDDYREALQAAYDQYAEQTINETLTAVFDQYRQCLAEGKPFNWNTDEARLQINTGENEMKKRIFAVRKLRGEPENLDFMKKEKLKM